MHDYGEKRRRADPRHPAGDVLPLRADLGAQRIQFNQVEGLAVAATST